MCVWECVSLYHFAIMSLVVPSRKHQNICKYVISTILQKIIHTHAQYLENIDAFRRIIWICIKIQLCITYLFRKNLCNEHVAFSNENNSKCLFNAYLLMSLAVFNNYKIIILYAMHSYENINSQNRPYGT